MECLICFQNMSEQGPLTFKDGYCDWFFIAFCIQRFVCYLYWVFDVKDLF